MEILRSTQPNWIYKYAVHTSVNYEFFYIFDLIFFFLVLYYPMYDQYSIHI